MDVRNTFHTRSTFLLVRAEHVLVVIACVVLALMHLGQIDWLLFVGVFVLIDLIGYIPGAVAWRRRDSKRISATYHWLYNVTHSYLTGAAIVGVWVLLASGFEWAMLAVPIHLSGDRGLFGNIYKPRELPFEPVAVPATDP